VSILVVATCTTLFLVLTALRLLHLVGWQQALYVLALSREGLFQRLWLFQLLTAPLLHVDAIHLAFNMLTLWMLGPDVEAALGRRYIIFSILCAQSASAAFLLWNPGPGAITCGYSSVIFGILVAQAVFFPNRTLYIYAFFPLKMKYAAIILGAVEAYLSVTPGQRGVAHVCHLFGALGGWVYLLSARRYAWKPRAKHDSQNAAGDRRPAPRRAPLSSSNRDRSGHADDHDRGGPRRPAGAAVPLISAPPYGGPLEDESRQDPSGVNPINGAPATGQCAYLLALTGPLAGRRFDLSSTPITFGRAAENHIVVPDDAKVSRVHAEIIPEQAGRYLIVDRKSRNGTFVNGQRAERRVLQHGDRIRIGVTEMVFAALQGRE
jgi:membrane associated rhomboid family serine protease